jgi:hypothetical protein
MTERLEHELRQLFAEDAERATAPLRLAEQARRQVRHRRNIRLAWGSGALVAATAIAVAVVGGGGLLGGEPTGSPSPPVAAAQGPLPDGGAASCVEEYSPAAVTGRAFAFDGTVTDIGPARGDAGLDLAAVSFTVHEWFAGGSGAAFTVDMTPPQAGGGTEDSPPAYAVGTRLLVSGEDRWGEASLDDAIAWGCGFSRYYDQTTANRWRTAFS